MYTPQFTESDWTTNTVQKRVIISVLDGGWSEGSSRGEGDDPDDESNEREHCTDQGDHGEDYGASVVLLGRLHIPS